MILDKINLENKLFDLKIKTTNEADVLAAVQSILNQDEKSRDIINNRLNGNSDSISNDFNFDLLETKNIYHVSTIKSICVDYRLRFLDSSLFKNKIPEEAISKIKNLEKNHEIVIDGFKIMAPAKLFKLENADDPLLFAPIGNDYYYLIHKWGNDLSPFRKFLMLPFKTLLNSVVTLLLLSFISMYLLPISKFGPTNLNVIKVISFLFIFKTYCAIFLYYSFWMGKNFSTEIWNSKYYN